MRDAIALGMMIEARPIRFAVIGCGDGFGQALLAGRAIRDRNPDARLVLVCDESVEVIQAVGAGEVWTACVQRPFDPAAVRSLLAGQTGGVPCRDR